MTQIKMTAENLVLSESFQRHVFFNVGKMMLYPEISWLPLAVMGRQWCELKLHHSQQTQHISNTAKDTNPNRNQNTYINMNA